MIAIYGLIAIVVIVLVLIGIDQKWVPLPDQANEMTPERAACISVFVAIATGIVWPVLLLMLIGDLGSLLVNYITKTKQFAPK